MSKIAALILPRAQEARVGQLAEMAGTMLSLAGDAPAMVHRFTGNETVCALIQVGADPYARAETPTHPATLLCGYYFSDPATLAQRGSLAQICADLDAGGPDALCKGDGVYAYVRWDGQDQLVAGVDKLGLRPLYWARLPAGGYAVASEIKALVPLLGQPAINWSAWEEQLILGFNLENHTLFDTIYRFGPAQTMRADGRSAHTRPVEDFLAELAAIESAPPEQAIEEHQHSFIDAIALSRRLAPSAARMLTLSGGFDSRRILAAMLHEGDPPTSYTVPDIKADGLEFESAIVVALCDRVGIPARRVCPPNADLIPQVLRIRDLMVDFESDEHGFAAVLAMALHLPGHLNMDGLFGDVVVNGRHLEAEHCAPGGSELFRRQVLAGIPRPWCDFPIRGAPLAERLDAHLQSLPGAPFTPTFYRLSSRLRREIILAPVTIQGDAFESYFPYTHREVMRSALTIPAEVRAAHQMQWRLAGMLDERVTSVPHGYDPAVAGDPRYRREHPQWKLRNRRSSLADALHGMRQPSVRPFVPLAQRMRLHALRALMPVLSPSRLVWQLKKLEFIDRFSRFMEMASSPEQYVRGLEPLRGVIGSRPDWVSPTGGERLNNRHGVGVPRTD